MWKKAQNSSPVKPDAADTASSKKWNYIRRNFVFVEERKSGQEVTEPEHWEWEEQKVLKEDWDTYQTILGHDSTLNDVQDAIIELAEIMEEKISGQDEGQED